VHLACLALRRSYWSPVRILGAIAPLRSTLAIDACPRFIMVNGLQEKGSQTMSRTKSLFATAVMGCLSLAGIAFADAPVTDSQITDRVMGKLTVDDPAVAKRVQVATKDGVVTLTGVANTGVEALRVLHEAQSVSGVVKVQNRLSVRQ